MTSHSNNTSIFGNFANKHFIAPNLNLVNEPNLMRILQSEIFVHFDRQLRVAHIILGYKPISTSFQAFKYMIKAKDHRLHQINVVIPGFLAGPLPKGTYRVELPSEHRVKEEATSSHLALEEAVKVIEVSDFEEDFGAFD